MKTRIVECQRCGFLREMPVLPGRHTKVLCELCAIARRREYVARYRKSASRREVTARYRERNREKLREDSRNYQIARRVADPEYAERGREHIRQLTRERPEHLSEIRRRSYAKHAEKRREESRKHKLIRRREIWERDARLCHICRQTILWQDLEIDHVVPRSCGGTNDPTNLAASHRACNRRKSAQSLEECLG